jgi:hypothetical protein
MNNSEWVEVPHSLDNLEDQLFDSLFWKRKVTVLNVVKQIFTSQILQHDVVVFGVFKDIDKLDNAFMLAHLQHLDFSSLLVNFDLLHVCLFHHFDRCFHSCLFVSRQLDQPKLTFAQGWTQIVKVKNIAVAHRLLQLFFPLIHDFQIVEVQNARFVGR